MSATTNIHNTDAVILGTAEFSFSRDAVSAADAKLKGYLDFGNIVSVAPAPDITKLEHKAARRGVRVTDKTVITDSKLQYTLKVDELDREKLMFALLGIADDNFEQAAIAGVAGTALAFTVPAPSQDNTWYDVLSAAGSRVRNLTSVTFATGAGEDIENLVAGVDFEVDLLLGRVRFLTAQTVTVTPTITAPAITEADGLKGINPMQQGIHKGYGRLSIFDDSNRSKLVYDHVDFSCEISFNAISDFDGQNYTELTLDVLVTTDPGKVYCAE